MINDSPQKYAKVEKELGWLREPGTDQRVVGDLSAGTAEQTSAGAGIGLSRPSAQVEREDESHGRAQAGRDRHAPLWRIVLCRTKALGCGRALCHRSWFG